MNVRNIVVDHPGLEGTLLINSLTGEILTPSMDRPEWSDGLQLALVGERLAHYYGNEKIVARLSRDEHPALLLADHIDFQDLGWIAMTPEGEQVTVEADPSYRSEKLAEVLGLPGDAEVFDQTLGQMATYEQAVVANDTRMIGEVATIDAMKEAGFGKAEGANAANGTN